MTRAQLEETAADSWTAEHQRRAALYDVERAMLPRLNSERVGLGTRSHVRCARAVEELRDSLVGVGMAQHVRLEVGAIGIIGAIAAARGGIEFVGDRRDDERILILDRVLADLFDDFERQRAAVVSIALESNHPAARPHFVCVGAPGDREIDVSGRSVGQHREDRRIAGVVLMRIESLSAGAFGAKLAPFVGFTIHLFCVPPLSKKPCATRHDECKPAKAHYLMFYSHTRSIVRALRTNAHSRNSETPNRERQSLYGG